MQFKKRIRLKNNINFNEKYDESLKLVTTIIPEYVEEIKQIFFTYSHKYQSFIDLGCSYGHYYEIYKSNFKEIIFADLIDIRSDRLKDFPFIKINLNEENIFEKKFDFIFCLEVIEHIENESILFNNLKKIANNNGYLVISTPNVNRLFNLITFKKFLPKEHIREYTITELCRKLEKYGFKIIRKGIFLNRLGSYTFFFNIPICLKQNIILLAQKIDG